MTWRVVPVTVERRGRPPGRRARRRGRRPGRARAHDHVAGREAPGLVEAERLLPLLDGVGRGRRPLLVDGELVGRDEAQGHEVGLDLARRRDRRRRPGPARATGAGRRTAAGRPGPSTSATGWPRSMTEPSAREPGDGALGAQGELGWCRRSRGCRRARCAPRGRGRSPRRWWWRACRTSPPRDRRRRRTARRSHRRRAGRAPRPPRRPSRAGDGAGVRRGGWVRGWPRGGGGRRARPCGGARRCGSTGSAESPWSADGLVPGRAGVGRRWESAVLIPRPPTTGC